MYLQLRCESPFEYGALNFKLLQALASVDLDVLYHWLMKANSIHYILVSTFTLTCLILPHYSLVFISTVSYSLMTTYIPHAKYSTYTQSYSLIVMYRIYYIYGTSKETLYIRSFVYMCCT